MGDPVALEYLLQFIQLAFHRDAGDRGLRRAAAVENGDGLERILPAVQPLDEARRFPRGADDECREHGRISSQNRPKDMLKDDVPAERRREGERRGIDEEEPAEERRVLEVVADGEEGDADRGGIRDVGGAPQRCLGACQAERSGGDEHREPERRGDRGDRDEPAEREVAREDPPDAQEIGEGVGCDEEEEVTQEPNGEGDAVAHGALRGIGIILSRTARRAPMLFPF